MALKRPTIALFDMDGTTVRHINPMLLGILEALDDTGYKTSRIVSQLLRRPIDYPRLVEHRVLNGQERQRPKLIVHRALHRVRRKPIEEIVEPCPGIYTVLELLQAAGVEMGLISNGLGKGYGHDILKKFDLERFFSVTVFREDILRPKPAPDPILLALEQMPRAVQANDVVWFLGDRRKDVLAALAARAYVPCRIEPFAYNLHAAIAILENKLPTDHIVMAWPDMAHKLRALL